jgi:hypothetical protein
MDRRRKENIVLYAMSYCNHSYYVSNPQVSCAIPSMAVYSQYTPNIWSPAKWSVVNFKINFVRDEILVGRFTCYVIFVKFTLHIDTTFCPKDMVLFVAQTVQLRDVTLVKYLCHQPYSVHIYVLFVVIACDIDSMTWSMLTRREKKIRTITWLSITNGNTMFSLCLWELNIPPFICCVVIQQTWENCVIWAIATMFTFIITHARLSHP